MHTLMHEIGHLLGYEHTDEGLMAPTLAASPVRPSSSVLASSSFILPPSSFLPHPSSRIDEAFADLGRDEGSQQTGQENLASNLLGSRASDLLAAATIRSSGEAGQAWVPRRSRLERYERELDNWFAALAGEDEGSADERRA